MTGQPSSWLSASRTGKPSQPGMIGGATGTPSGKRTGPGHADAGAVEPLGEPGGRSLAAIGEHLLEDGDRALAYVHGLVEVPEHLQLGVGDGDVDRGRADVDAEEAQGGSEPDVVRAAAAAGGGESVGHDQARLQQPVDLDGQLGP